jgi:hypothetical protein
MDCRVKPGNDDPNLHDDLNRHDDRNLLDRQIMS